MQFRNVAFDFTAILPNHRYSPNFNSITFNLNFFFRIQFSTLIRFSFFRASIKEPSGKSTRKFFQDETFCLVRWITSSASNEICQCYLWYWRYRQGRFQNSSPEIGTVFLIGKPLNPGYQSVKRNSDKGLFFLVWRVYLERISSFLETTESSWGII